MAEFTYADRPPMVDHFTDSPHGIDNAGFTPPGQFSEHLDLISKQASAAQAAENMAIHTRDAVFQAAAVEQQALLRAMSPLSSIANHSATEGLSEKSIDIFILFASLQLPSFHELLLTDKQVKPISIKEFL